jgi:4-amino-4-deoxy-L-arabinose transferase-like glycosyltransferase
MNARADGQTVFRTVMADTSGKNRNRKNSSGSKPPSGKTDPLLRNLKDFVVEEIELTSAPLTGPKPKRRWLPRWWTPLKISVGALCLALFAVAAGLATRSAWPSDETRFLAIAWEMWARGDLLVPRLNGAVVSVAPLYAWVVHLGWIAFGEVEWWARLVPALFMFGSLLLAGRVAGRLWPGSADVKRYMPFVLLGGIYWVWSSTWFTPDFLAVFFTLFALHALLWMWRTRDLRVWLLLGIALGFGLLASGSLILIYVLPIALLAPLWTRGTPTMPWGYWYADLVKATLAGFVIFALWAVPFAGRAGIGALLPLLTAPVATHALDLFPAARPWWWYLFLLPWLGFPWILWPLPWLRLWHIRRQPIANGLAFCMLWAVTVIGILSLFPVRQPQLLLPLVPAFFLVTGWLLLDERLADHDHSRLASTMIFPLMLLGAALAVVPKLPRIEFLPEILWQLSPFVGVAVIGLGVAVGWLPIPEVRTRILNMAVTVVVVLALVTLTLGWQLNADHDASGLARPLRAAQRDGKPVAHVGPYAGQFHFVAQLGQPLTVLAPDEAAAWVAANPDAWLITYSNGWQPRAPAGAIPDYEQAYDGAQLRLWRTAILQGGAP